MRNWIITFVLLLGILPVVQAETVQEKGLAIITESDNRDKGWQDSSADMVMTLRNRKGKESIREIRVKNLEVDGDGDKGLTVFDQPRDVKGTAFLTYSHALEPDEQWIFLPALKRIKRISSSNKSGPFMGSEFAYEDISSFEIPKYSYLYLREEMLDGHDTFVLEIRPQYKHSGYTKSHLWIDKKEYRIQKIDFYDRKDALLKTQQFSDYKKYLDQYWRAHTMTMNNHQNGKSTTLKWSNYTFQNGLTDKDFEKNDLKRQR
ncbi:MAG: outer membrane lipoprotein-sorting protein [Gammaproteobacteria bacterium]|nr:MAG: outer membrane lipoprotein-sorting protein [Gammaproteobacteria bacterium]RKZ95924.1 MAG: outer membrane lipoprotein-sorting protein [Gammaproteobacteria bacterium]RKZ98820.1 MAG: outer membrane lipoprotein-sorting protein [Gammaproteobacteria bacterium]RKZ99896.1 MAG: outer membrane lipoprotein-sorting protein [Gammaproteobacteria bacterium]